MTAIEIARQLAALGQSEGAIKAYGLVLHQAQSPEEELESALYILQNGGDHRVSYSALIGLYRRGQFRDDCLSILTQAFYEPNVKLLKTRYENNRKLLEKYPYLFRKDFLDFEFLPLRFYPYDDNRFVPYHVREERFGEYIDFKRPVVSRNFFKDLDKPVFAVDVYSQYELEYLNDSVRQSEYIGRDNHIYLHYLDWPTFCAYLQCLNMRPLLDGKKFVFLIGDEVDQYPIDFQERFGIDYSIHPVKTVSIREVNRLIWHTQLSSHNGGDYFNEIFDIHPNLLMISSVIFKSIQDAMDEVRKVLDESGSTQEAVQRLPQWNPRIVEELYLLWDRTDKDIMVAFFLKYMEDYERKHTPYLDKAARIAPVVFFQPHFYNLIYRVHLDNNGRSMLESDEYEAIRTSPLFRGFKYIKTFTPLRRMTVSYGATVRFITRQLNEDMEKALEDRRGVVISDIISQRVLNRSFMIDWMDRLYADSVLVRFEDGKLNPKATFTALAAFLDLPYTQSMTYCSLNGEIDPEEMEGNVRGFDTATVFRTYDDVTSEAERIYVEYFLRDAYEYYGYDFHYYKGEPMDEVRLRELVENFTALDGLVHQGYMNMLRKNNTVRVSGVEENGDAIMEQIQSQLADQEVNRMRGNRIRNAQALLAGLKFVNKNGQPLHMMPRLELDPALLEQPLYH